MQYLPHTLLQIAQHRNGKLYVATNGPTAVAWEVCPLIDGAQPTNYPPIDANDKRVPRPQWAIDAYAIPAWELACRQYDGIGA